MAQVTIEYDARNVSAKKFLEAFLSLPFFKIKEEKEKSPYDPEFVKKIEESKKQYKEGKYKAIKTEDLWK
jgi:hypothetical protein